MRMFAKRRAGSTIGTSHRISRGSAARGEVEWLVARRGDTEGGDDAVTAAALYAFVSRNAQAASRDVGARGGEPGVEERLKKI